MSAKQEDAHEMAFICGSLAVLIAIIWFALSIH